MGVFVSLPLVLSSANSAVTRFLVLRAATPL